MIYCTQRDFAICGTKDKKRQICCATREFMTEDNLISKMREYFWAFELLIKKPLVIILNHDFPFNMILDQLLACEKLQSTIWNMSQQLVSKRLTSSVTQERRLRRMCGINSSQSLCNLWISNESIHTQPDRHSLSSWHGCSVSCCTNCRLLLWNIRNSIWAATFFPECELVLEGGGEREMVTQEIKAKREGIVFHGGAASMSILMPISAKSNYYLTLAKCRSED